MGNAASTTAKPSPPRSIDPAELYKTPPPKFGHDVRSLFAFGSDYVNLNNGSYGSLPLPVRHFCDELTDKLESNPDEFMRITRFDHVNRVRERLAKIIGSEPDECVFVPNTSHGLATVLRNFVLNEGDILVGITTTFPSVSKTLEYLSDYRPYPTLSTFGLQFPAKRAQILRDYEEHIKRVTRIPDPTGKRKIVAIIDVITSHPGVWLPWKEMVAICRDAGVISVVDGAHSLGQQVDLGLSEAQPDFFVSDCHKWFYAKRACAFLYVPRRNHHFIKSPIPTPNNYRSPSEHPETFLNLFGWNGTIDFVPQVSIGAAIDFRQWLGGEHKINEYTRALAVAGGKYLAERLGTSVMDPDGDMTLSLFNVELPLPGEIEDTDEVQQIFVETLIVKWHVYSGSFKHNGKWWVRCSTQIWNEITDFDVLANALEDACQKVKEYAAQESS